MLIPLLTCMFIIKIWSTKKGNTTSENLPPYCDNIIITLLLQWFETDLKSYAFTLLKYLPQTSAVTNNPNQNVYHLPPNLCILWHPLVCLATLVFTCQLYCPAHIVFRIPCFLLCSSVLCRDYASLELGKVL